MKVSSFISFLFFLLVFNTAISSESLPQPDNVDLHVKIPVTGAGEVDKLLSMGLMIEANIVENNIAEGFISREDLARVKEAGFRVAIIEDRVYDQTGESGRQSFYTFESTGAQLIKWANDYPNLMKLDTLGKSQKGEPIWVFHISSMPDSVPVTRIYLNGATHGNENIGTEVVMWVAEDLLTKYDSDQSIKELVDRTEWVMHPIVNPDGFKIHSRRLADGKDPNRCGGYHVGTKGGSLPFEPPELMVYRYVMVQAPVHFNCDFHCGTTAQLIAFFASGVSLDLDKDAYSKAKALYPLPGFKSNTPSFAFTRQTGGITSDVPAGKYGSVSLMPELCSHNPSASKIAPISTHGYESIAKILEEMKKGVSGRVSCAVSGEPLYARVQVEGKYAPTFADHRSGGYFKYITSPTSTYEVTAYANGYKKETKTVSANAHGLAELDFELTPDPQQPFAALSVDAILCFNNMAQSKLLNCLELNDGSSTEFKGGTDAFIDLDFGPTPPVVDKQGDDITVYASGATYEVSAALSVDDIDKSGNVLGTGSDKKSFDLSEAGLDTVRFVRISCSSGTLQLDAVEAEPCDFTGVKDNPVQAVVENTFRVTPLSGSGVLLETYMPKGEYAVSVYSLSGREIMTVAKGIQETEGMRTFRWSGSDTNGAVCAPGMYLFRVTNTRGTNVLKTPVMW